MKAILCPYSRAPSRSRSFPPSAAPIAVLALFLVLSAGPAAAQGAYLDRGQSGKGAEARVLMKGGEFQAAGGGAGYCLEGFLDLGLDLNAAVATAASGGALEMRAAVAVALPVLKQDAQIPLTLVVRGSFAKTAFMGDALDAASLVKQGTGFSAGLDLLHTVTLTPQWALRLGVTGTYESFTHVTAASGAAVAGYPSVETASNLFGGLLVGAVFRPSKAFLAAVSVRASMDRTLSTFWLEPSVTIAAPDL